jgi:hypothetical protein
MNDKISLEEQFVQGTKNICTNDHRIPDKPLVVRGVIKKDHIDRCKSTGRDFYYIDTGYIGNFPSAGNPSGKKIWHRVVKNDVQHCEIRKVSNDRWNALVEQDPRLQWSGWKNYDKKILLIVPNPKACRYYGLDYDQWMEETTKKIKDNIDLPIEVRIKGTRSERNQGYSIYEAFDTGVYATVAMNSIAALESVLYGIPAFVSVPCAASPLSSLDLSLLGNPYKPSVEKILSQCHNLAYGQFTGEELENSTAWRLAKENYEIINQ